MRSRETQACAECMAKADSSMREILACYKLANAYAYCAESIKTPAVSANHSQARLLSSHVNVQMCSAAVLWRTTSGSAVGTLTRGIKAGGPPLLIQESSLAALGAALKSRWTQAKSVTRTPARSKKESAFVKSAKVQGVEDFPGRACSRLRASISLDVNALAVKDMALTGMFDSEDSQHLPV